MTSGFGEPDLEIQLLELLLCSWVSTYSVHEAGHAFFLIYIIWLPQSSKRTDCLINCWVVLFLRKLSASAPLSVFLLHHPTQLWFGQFLKRHRDKTGFILMDKRAKNPVSILLSKMLVIWLLTDCPDLNNMCVCFTQAENFPWEQYSFERHVILFCWAG